MERRLSAVLVADVAGYSRLMEADEESTLVRFNLLRENLIEPRIQANHGRLVKLMGDGMLVEFPSAVDAVKCGLEIQQEANRLDAPLAANGRMPLRIGINLGDVVVQDGDIFGDGVNLAARLQQLGEPGSVTVSDDVLRQVQNRLSFGCEDLGKQRVKNVSRPVHAWRLTNTSAESVSIDSRSRARWRWVLRAGLAAGLAAAGLAAWIALDHRHAAVRTSGCTDHLGLPVAAEACPDRRE